MAETDVAALMREAMMVMLKLGGPPLLVGVAVGVLVSFVQAITQINESALAFAPKALAVCAALVLLGPFMLAVLSDYTRQLFDKLIAIGGS
jgi:flagellar biosynthesis protein FliQ